jgi:hypothetical protein
MALTIAIGGEFAKAVRGVPLKESALLFTEQQLIAGKDCCASSRH